jgi:hypothetical protein
VTSQELLLMLVLNVLDNEETSDVVNQRVLVLRVIEDCLLVLAIVTD